jgi:hypothetical protein
MNSLKVLLLSACFSILVLDSALDASAQTKFDLKCHPFSALEVPHAIDSSCPKATGNATTPTSGQALQNQAKNNFCAAAPFVDISHDDLLALETLVEALPEFPSWNRQHLPPGRNPFTTTGGHFNEGMAVRYTGYVFEAHPADTSSGESVNCKKLGVSANDIHIALVQDPKAKAKDECKSVTAEMSPHFRPTLWTAKKISSRVALFVFNSSTKKYVRNKTSTRNLVRVSGQLMFDAAHKACSHGKPGGGDPARASLWEVHPVYQIEICTNTVGGACADADWQPLDKFLSTH